jgi:hypothetical protein
MANIQLGQKALWDTVLTADDSTRKEDLGILRFEISDPEADNPQGMKVYRYVKVHASSAAVANGTVVVYRPSEDAAAVLATAVDNKWTADTRIAQATRNAVCGVGIGTITAGQYGWVQVRGYHSAVKTNGDDDIAEGDVLIHSGADGTVDSVTAGTAPTYLPIGVAVAADDNDNNTVAAQLCIE